LVGFNRRLFFPTKYLGSAEGGTLAHKLLKLLVFGRLHHVFKLRECFVGLKTNIGQGPIHFRIMQTLSLLLHVLKKIGAFQPVFYGVKV